MLSLAHKMNKKNAKCINIITYWISIQLFIPHFYLITYTAQMRNNIIEMRLIIPLLVQF